MRHQEPTYFNHRHSPLRIRCKEMDQRGLGYDEFEAALHIPNTTGLSGFPQFMTNCCPRRANPGRNMLMRAGKRNGAAIYRNCLRRHLGFAYLLPVVDSSLLLFMHCSVKSHSRHFYDGTRQPIAHSDGSRNPLQQAREELASL